MTFPRSDDMVTVMNQSTAATAVSLEVNGAIRALKDSVIMPGREVTYGFFSTGDTVVVKANGKAYKMHIPIWRPSQNSITVK